MNIDDLPTPSLVLDLDVLETNLEDMAQRCHERATDLRPHVKTHKCIEIARRQCHDDCPGITVSTLHEAELFADHGFDDITWAFPVIPSRLATVRRLSERLDAFRLVVDSPRAVDWLQETPSSFHVWLQIDCGYGRVGVRPDSESTTELARRIVDSDSLVFDGILTHSGQAYHARGAAKLESVAERERRVMVDCAERLRDDGLPVPGVSIGSTPATSHAANLDGITEVRPGNYAFFDFTQTVIGSCDIADCALTVLATIVSAPAAHDHCVVDAGALSLSMDPGPEDASPDTMGEIFSDYADNELAPDTRLVNLSQEHGTVSRSLPMGTRVRILENHSCLTAACFDHYHVVRGDQVVDRWTIHRGRS
ncbi:MAG: alanine racemase [Bradymonadaceae bacterium]